MTRRNSEGPGFTLIEMIIVFALIGILVGLGLPQYQSAAKRAREAVLKEDLFQFRKLIDQYFQDKGKYPASLQTLVDEKVPQDHPGRPHDEIGDDLGRGPGDAGPRRIYPPPENMGVIDVRSGSEAKALDGTIFNTW